MYSFLRCANAAITQEKNVFPKHYRNFRQLSLFTASIVLLIILAFSLVACASAKPPKDTPVPPEAMTAAAKQAEDVIKNQVTQTAAAQQAAVDKTVTSQAALTQTEAARPTATRTPTPTKTPTSTITPNLLATQKYEAMFAKIEQYAKDGYIPSTNGTYYSLPDYSDNWAQINYYRWYSTGYSPENFVIESDVEYASASDIANWFESGCGFVFHADENNQHYAVFIVMDGHAFSHAISDGKFIPMGDAYLGKLDIPTGKVHFVLVVNGKQYALFLNGKLVKKFEGIQGKLTKGDLAYSIISGTNTGSGTSCKFTNTGLWEVNP
jgi:hypothetical protein